MSDYFELIGQGDDYEELERMKKEMLDEEEKAQAEDLAHKEKNRKRTNAKEPSGTEDRIEFAEITCPGCTVQRDQTTRPTDVLYRI